MPTSCSFCLNRHYSFPSFRNASINNVFTILNRKINIINTKTGIPIGQKTSKTANPVLPLKLNGILINKNISVIVIIERIITALITQFSFLKAILNNLISP
jgi:hypothetical protein